MTDSDTDGNSHRRRLTYCSGIYAFLIGAAAILTGIMAQTDKYEEAVRMSPVPTMVFGFFGGLAASLITMALIYTLRREANYSARYYTYVIIAFIFWIIWPVLSGFFTPLAVYLILYISEPGTIGEFFSRFFDQFFVGMVSSIVLGTLYLYTAFIASIFLTAGTYLIDRINISHGSATFLSVPIGLALALGMIPVLLVSFLSPEIIRMFG